MRIITLLLKKKNFLFFFNELIERLHGLLKCICHIAWLLKLSSEIPPGCQFFRGRHGDTGTFLASFVLSRELCSQREKGKGERGRNVSVLLLAHMGFSPEDSTVSNFRAVNVTPPKGKFLKPGYRTRVTLYPVPTIRWNPVSVSLKHWCIFVTRCWRTLACEIYRLKTEHWLNGHIGCLVKKGIQFKVNTRR